MKTENLVINFLGDSITEGYDASSPEKIFHALLKEELNLKDVRNYGVSGTRISRQDGGDINFIEDFCQRAERMEDADVIVVFGGTNDFGHGTSPMGVFEDRSNYSFYGALHCLSQILIKKYTGKPIIFMTPLHRADEVNGGEGAKQGNYTLYDYVCAIKEVAKYYAIPVLDLYSVSMIQPQDEYVREKLCPDGLHPNNDGHRLIADRLKGFIQSL